MYHNLFNSSTTEHLLLQTNLKLQVLGCAACSRTSTSLHVAQREAVLISVSTTDKLPSSGGCFHPLSYQRAPLSHNRDYTMLWCYPALCMCCSKRKGKSLTVLLSKVVLVLNIPRSTHILHVRLNAFSHSENIHITTTQIKKKKMDWQPRGESLVSLPVTT